MSAEPSRTPSARWRLLRWANRFAATNVALVMVVGLGYLWHYTPVGVVGWTYAAIAYLGHLAALSYVPLALVLVPAAVLIPWPRVLLPLGAVLAAVGVSFFLLDSLLFAQNRYHLNVVTFTLLDPKTFAFLGLYFLIGLAIEGMLAARIWQRTALAPRGRIGLCVALGLAGCFVASHLVFAWAEARYYMPVTAFTRYLPLYYPLNARQFQLKYGLLDRSVAHEAAVVSALGRPPDGVLNYPLAPLRCEPRPPMLNVLFVVIDGMRADALTPEVAPRLSELARGAVQFNRHYSGGNASRAGMFSLFYGLPAPYWDAFADAVRPPAVMEMFRLNGYQLGAFVSSTIYTAIGLDRTALSRVSNLRLQTYSPYPGAGHSGKDRQMTDEWHEWLGRQDPSRPFWGLLYYNAAVAVDPPTGAPLVVPVAPGAPEQVREHARYLTAVHYIDSLFGGVVDDLERRKLLDRTVIIVTSDHGMEFDDSGLGFTGHSTAYSEYQLHTPLIVRWPGRPPGHVTRRTSHNDIAPTLLTELFGCTNPPSDYSSGHSLFTDREWSWLIAASYSDFAVVEPDRVTIVLSAGYEMRDRSYRLILNPTLPRDTLSSAMREMSRFYR
jgi:membrane-anchored protein YejM (alkaline phosphatase superfamily)